MHSNYQNYYFFVRLRVVRCFETHGYYCEPETVPVNQSSPMLTSQQVGFFSAVTSIGRTKSRRPALRETLVRPSFMRYRCCFVLYFVRMSTFSTD